MKFKLTKKDIECLNYLFWDINAHKDYSLLSVIELIDIEGDYREREENVKKWWDEFYKKYQEYSTFRRRYVMTKLSDGSWVGKPKRKPKTKRKNVTKNA
jgi:hypothetical protein